MLSVPGLSIDKTRKRKSFKTQLRAIRKITKIFSQAMIGGKSHTAAERGRAFQFLTTKIANISGA